RICAARLKSFVNDSVVLKKKPPAATAPADDYALADNAPSGSEGALLRIRSRWGEPLFIADWDSALMIHYEVEALALQKHVPFELDLFNGRAFVSVVAFTMRRMRPWVGGSLTACLLRPISTNDFLNVRTYVKHETESGIYFMSEWLSNRLSVALGPITFGLPYRYGKIKYDHSLADERLAGRVDDITTGGVFAYRAALETRARLCECHVGTMTEWLMERYTAFTCSRGVRRFFRVWHEPWLQIPAHVQIDSQSLLEANWAVFHHSQIRGA